MVLSVLRGNNFNPDKSMSYEEIKHSFRYSLNLTY